MTPQQKHDFEKNKSNISSPAQFRRLSVLNDFVPERNFGPHTDPDQLSESDWIAYMQWKSVKS